MSCEAAEGPSYRIGFVTAASHGWLTEVSIEMCKFIDNINNGMNDDSFALFTSNSNRLLMY